MIIRELFVRLGVDSKDAEEALEEFDQAIGELNSSLGDLIGFLGKVAAGFAAVTTAAGAVAVKTAEWSEEIVRNSDALGMSTDKYQELHFAFRNLGASTDDMMDAFSTLTDRALDAAEGSKTYIDEFERVGIAIEDLKGKRPDQLFDMYVQATANAEDRTAAVATAVRLFGDDLGRRIVPALTTSAESFEQWREIARSTGIVMDEALVRKAREVRMNMRALEGRVMALVYTLGHKLMPFVDKLVKELNIFIDRIQNNSVAIDQFSQFARELTDDLTKLIETFTGLISFAGVFDEGSKAASKLAVVIRFIATTITAILALGAWKALVAVFGAIKAIVLSIGIIASAKIVAAFVAIVGAITAALYIVEDIYGWFMGWDSLIGRIFNQFGDGTGILDSLATLASSIKNVIQGWIEPIKVVAGLIWSSVVTGFKTLWTFVGPIAGFIIDIVVAVFELIAAIGIFFTRIIEGDWSGALIGLFQDVIAVVFNLIVDAFTAAFELIFGIVQELFVAPLAGVMDGLDKVLGMAGVDVFEGLGDSMLSGFDEMSEGFLKTINFQLAQSSEKEWARGGDWTSDMMKSGDERATEQQAAEEAETERIRKQRESASSGGGMGVLGSLSNLVFGSGDKQQQPKQLATAGLPYPAQAVPPPVMQPQKTSPEIFIDTIQIASSLAAEEEKANIAEILSRSFKMANSSAAGGER